MPRAVLDANIYVSALIQPNGPPGRILDRLLRRDAFTAVLSPSIIVEMQRALSYPKVRKLLRGDLDPLLWFEDIIVLSDLVADTPITPGTCADADDEKYIAAAVEAQAEYVVTGDGLLLAVKEYGRVRVVAPRIFLTLLET